MKSTSLLKRINKSVLSVFVAFVALLLTMNGVLDAVYRFWDWLVFMPHPEAWNVLLVIGEIIGWAKYLAIAVGMAVWMFAGRKISDKAYSVCFAVSAGLAAILTGSLFFVRETLGIICLLGAVLAASSALGLLLGRVARIISPKRVGIFVGCGIALSLSLNFAVFSPIFWEPLPFWAVIEILSVAAIIAAIMGIPDKETSKAAIEKDASNAVVQEMPTPEKDTTNAVVEETPAPEKDTTNAVMQDELTPELETKMQPKKFFFLTIVVMVLSSLTAFAMTNYVVYFREVSNEVPNIFMYLSVFSFLILIAAGILFDKKLGAWGFLAGFLSMCVGQAMALFFAESPMMGVPYYALIYIGDYLPTVFIIATPIYIATRDDKKTLPQLGYIISSLCAIVIGASYFLLRSMLELEMGFDPALGLALLLSVSGLVLSLVLCLFRLRHNRRTVSYPRGVADEQ